MRVIAVIPARGGSKGVPLKNISAVGQRPLIVRAVESCLDAASVHSVVVSTDSDAIADAAQRAGARIVRRPASLSGDTASSESALLHALDVIAADGDTPDVTVFVQCTSPFIDPATIDSAVSSIVADEADSVFSAVRTHEFLWRSGPEGARGINHDHGHRPRRQDREAHFRETGAFYAFRTAGFRDSQHRFFGRIGIQEVPEAHAMEVDSPEDLEVVRALAPLVDQPSPLDVDAVVTDFDGVHTDDGATVDQNGRESVTVSRSDGMGVRLLLEADVQFRILSTETNPVVNARATKLRVPVTHGVRDKRAALLTWMDDEGLDPARVAYVGNDVNDLGGMSVVGWPVAVANAHPRVLAAARLVLTRPGGAGAVREVCERVLAARKG
ncbi:acylneuraminate cytidylyltransferase [Spiractinospora alimapuensis]|uniref:acylneuraminate cytidylyltransferase n=1 Tax=Spiractinospora alimapuensis TaxID=2820884 RepID=UPI001F26BA86|nr:acylneuraminate cytidylyltransferase [Spiractinospora alimapuensis]